MSQPIPETQFAVILPEQTGGIPIKVWATVEDPDNKNILYPSVDQHTILQASRAARLPFAYQHIALMADAHAGYGLPVGGVFAAQGAILPYYVGNDIGCGMCVHNTGVPIKKIDTNQLMKKWTQYVPVGNDVRKSNDRWLDNFQKFITELYETRDSIEEKYKIKMPRGDKITNQLGTLGGGNHFLELQEDEEGIAHIMIHSGSRGFGAEICRIFHDIARKKCKKWNAKLEDDSCAFLPVEEDVGQAYIEAMNLALRYAYENRLVMMHCAIEALKLQTNRVASTDNIENIHHNYASLENHFGKNVWVHRKGATLARKNTTGIIPGSMCSKSYIVKGLGCEQSFHSCSHGAGRNFSRSQAKKMVKEGQVPDQKTQLQKANVTLHGAKEVHDELGHSYKDISTVMRNQTGLIDIKKELKPVSVLKG